MKFKSASSRRPFLQGIGTAGAIAVSGLFRAEIGPRPASNAAEGVERLRVLALIGDRYHNPDYIRVGLDKVFRELQLSVDFTIDYEAISSRLLRDYRLFVCLRDGMIWPAGYLQPNGYEYSHELENNQGWPKEEFQPWIREDQGRAIRDFVSAGNSLYALHNSSNISLYSKEFREVMGGAYLGHPPLRPFKVRVVNREHPITRGIEDFMVTDEQHFVTFEKDPRYILLESENADGLTFEGLGAQSVCGWAYDFGQGRVVFTAIGHTLHALWQPEYLKIQRNAVRWLLRML